MVEEGRIDPNVTVRAAFINDASRAVGDRLQAVGDQSQAVGDRSRAMSDWSRAMTLPYWRPSARGCPSSALYARQRARI
jgi:hypothetical protein